MFWLLLLIVLFWTAYKLWTSAYSYWGARGFKEIPGKFPFGSSKELTLQSTFHGTIIKKMYDKMAPAPYFGVYTMRSPMLVLRDPEVIKLIMTKEFHHFQNRSRFERSAEEVLSQTLFDVDGEKWRILRTKLTPTFSSGKLKAMFPLFVSCAEAMNKMLLSRKNSDIVDVNTISSSYVSDTIFTCAFGLDVSSNLGSKAKQFANEIFKGSLLDLLNEALVLTIPKIITFYKPRLLPKESNQFFVKMVKETMDYREKNNVKRNDFIDLLMELKNKGSIDDEVADKGDQCHRENIEFTDELVASQCYAFFTAGFESASSGLTYTIYELALHQEMQQKLQEEIDTKLQEHGGLTYQAIQEMTYLDMVVSEGLRKNSPGVKIIRICTEDFTLPSGHTVEKGTCTMTSIYALHHDPQYFPNPEEFNPERFSAENKSSIKPYTYMPFGEGPRKCIAIRFALLQIKTGLVTFLQKYTVTPVKETKIPLTFRGSRLGMKADGPIYLKLVSRT